MSKNPKLETFDAVALSEEVLSHYDIDTIMPEAVDEAELLNPQAILKEARHHHPRGLNETIDLSFDS